MDDCNKQTSASGDVRSQVQIPLWTIVTTLNISITSLENCSDSSMDDCNGTGWRALPEGWDVQIPLWTIVTGRRICLIRTTAKFRFLYGRL